MDKIYYLFAVAFAWLVSLSIIIFFIIIELIVFMPTCFMD